MKIRAFGNWVLLLGSFCLVWGGSCQQLYAGQNYPNHVTAFGHSSAASTVPRRIDPAEEADIRQLLKIVGIKATVMRVMNTMEQDMTPLMVAAFPPGQYRARLVDLFFAKFRTKVTPQFLMNMAVPVYARYFSDADIKGLIKFYQTPLGQKWVRVFPKLQAGMLPRVQSLSRELGRQTMLEVLQEHPHLAQELKAAERAAHRD